MQLTEAKSVFETEAVNYLRIMTRQNNTVGFKIPEYQRPYNWHKRHLKRLLEDCINGFYRHFKSENEPEFTFLGTVILVNERKKEKYIRR